MEQRKQQLRERKRQRAWLLAGVALGLTLVAVIAFSTWRQSLRTQATQAFAEATSQVLLGTLQFEAAAGAMEAHHRGNLLIAQDRFIDDRERAFQRGLAAADGLMADVIDEPGQRAHVQAARQAFIARHEVMLEATAKDDPLDARAHFRLVGVAAYHRIRAELAQVRALAQRNLQDRTRQVRRDEIALARLLAIGTAGALSLVLVATFLLWRQLLHNERIHATLERDIADRQAAERALEVTNRELEAFSYTISHDLRAPLRHIDGYARMLREDAEGQLDEEMLRYIAAIGDGARHMGTLIDDLLAFSRLGRKSIECARVDMNDLARRALADAGGARSPAEVDIAPLPDAWADPVLLRQVWVNLLSNALKYSAPRGSDARIAVTGEREDGRVRYIVRDNGVGFDMQYADKLFSVFHRLHNQEQFEGTGVGLAIVQRILARHGGQVWAEAAPDQGATFTIELPDIERNVPAREGVPA